MKLWCIVYERTAEWRVPATNSEADVIRREVQQGVYRVLCDDSTVACALLSSKHRNDPAFVIKTFDTLDVDAVINVRHR